MEDYHRFLKQFDEEPRNTISECKEVMRCNLNVNLYDLLDWFRNPATAARPTRFETAQELGEYSYVNNKVFTCDFAIWSRIAKPLLRKIGQFKKPKRPVRPPQWKEWEKLGLSESPREPSTEETH